MNQNSSIYEMLHLLQKLWALVLVLIYFACFMNEYHYPGFREEPLEGEAIYWKIQRVLFFGLMGLGFLADVVQMRIDRTKAYFYLFMSLILGGLSGVIGAYQYRFLDAFLGLIFIPTG